MPMHFTPNIHHLTYPMYEIVVGNRLSRYTSLYKAVEKFFFPESSIKAITNFRKVCM